MKEETEYVKSIENELPLVSHFHFQNTWRKDVESILTGIDDTISAILDFRLHVHEISCTNESTLKESEDNHSLTRDDNWKWLLTTNQVEQRTTEWYNETVNLVTASEIASIWKGVGTRASLVMSKIPSKEIDGQKPFNKRPLAVARADTKAMFWGIRYEPVVKMYLEKSLGCTIQELGRIRHRTVDKLAASPDGLVIEGNKDIVGNLVEIKCPPTRIIKDVIPFEYWCQMQIQMEVCDRNFCEFVEAKFVEEKPEDPSTILDQGEISLAYNNDNGDMKYIYSFEEETTNSEEYTILETYTWYLVKLQRVLVKRDTGWFSSIQDDLGKFWKDVESARDGSFVYTKTPRKAKEKGKEEICAIID